MAAVSNIQQWITGYKTIYVTAERIIKGPDFQYFANSASFPTIPTVGTLAKSLKSRTGTFKSSKWGIENLTDADLASADLIISNQFFDVVTGSAKNSLDVQRVKNYLDQAELFLKIARSYDEGVKKSVRSWEYRSQLTEAIAIGAMTMMMTVLYPYHVFAHFAWHSTYTRKEKDPSDILTSYYDFFTESQFNEINKYTARMVLDKTLIDLLGGLTTDPRTGDNIDLGSAQDLAAMNSDLQGYSGSTASVRLLGANLSKLFIDTYTPD